MGMRPKLEDAIPAPSHSCGLGSVLTSKSQFVKLGLPRIYDPRSVMPIQEILNVPYQVLLNKLLRASIADQMQGDEAGRLDRLEKDVATLKRKLSA